MTIQPVEQTYIVYYIIPLARRHPQCASPMYVCMDACMYVCMYVCWSEGKGDAVLRRTALRFEGVASPPVRVCAGPILHIVILRP